MLSVVGQSVSSTQEGFKHAAKRAAFWRAVPFSSALWRKMKMGMFVQYEIFQHLTGEWVPGWRGEGGGGVFGQHEGDATT